MLRTSLLARWLCPIFAAARATVRRWRVRRWLKRNRDRIALIASDPGELSEIGRRIRSETIWDLQDKLRGLGPARTQRCAARRSVEAGDIESRCIWRGPRTPADLEGTDAARP